MARFDDLVVEEGDRAGLEAHQEEGTDRLADLVDKGTLFDLCWNNPRQLAAVAHVLDWQEFKVFSLNGRAALPSRGHQGLHVDWGSAVAPDDYQICNSIWMLDDFTEDNGATRIVPGSHRWGRLPQDDMSDPRDPHPGRNTRAGRGGDGRRVQQPPVARRHAKPDQPAPARPAFRICPPGQETTDGISGLCPAFDVPASEQRAAVPPRGIDHLAAFTTEGRKPARSFRRHQLMG